MALNTYFEQLIILLLLQYYIRYEYNYFRFLLVFIDTFQQHEQ